MIDAQWVADCLEGLRAAMPPETEIELRPGGHTTDGVEVAGWLRIRGPWGQTEFPVENKRRVNRAATALIDRRFRTEAHVPGDNHPAREPTWLLLTEQVTTRHAQHLRENGIAFADTRGNAHVWGPGLYVWVAGNRPATRKTRTPRLTRPAAARVMFAVLQDPQRAQAPYRDLAEIAGVAPDTVHRVFNDLEAKRYLKVWGARKRAATRLPELVELWALAYEDALRTKLQPKKCDWVHAGAVDQLVDLLPLGPDDPHILLGGDVAAAVLTGVLRPTTATLHVPPGTQREVMRALRLIPRPDGQITLLNTFGTTNEMGPNQAAAPLADPLLIHAELLCNDDDRAREAAAQIYDEYILKRFHDDQ